MSSVLSVVLEVVSSVLSVVLEGGVLSMGRDWDILSVSATYRFCQQ